MFWRLESNLYWVVWTEDYDLYIESFANVFRCVGNVLLYIFLHDYTLRIGPPRGGPDRRHITCPHRLFLTILNEFCIYDVSKATTGTTIMNAFQSNFSRSVPGVYFWSLQDRASYFLWSFCDDFRRFWTNFASMAWAKQQRERPKSTRFDACSQVDRQRAFLAIATTAFVLFVVILW